MDWHIALTQPGKDRIACEALRNRRYLVYYPILPVMVRHGRGRLRSVIRPMFPGYLFVIDTDGQGWGWLYPPQGVQYRGLLVINGRLATVDNGMVDEIKAEEQRQCTTKIKGEKIVVPYRVGDTVRVEDGPFSGLFGEVANLDDLERVCLLMSILGRDSRHRVFMSHQHLALP